MALQRRDWLLAFLAAAPTGAGAPIQTIEQSRPLDPIRIMKGMFLFQNEDTAIPSIGGQVRILAIYQQAGADGQHLRMIDPTSPPVQDGLTTWQILETEMFAELASWANPPSAAPPAAPPAAAPPGGAPAADLPPDPPHS
jgi:hypothetical protein